MKHPGAACREDEELVMASFPQWNGTSIQACQVVADLDKQAGDVFSEHGHVTIRECAACHLSP